MNKEHCALKMVDEVILRLFVASSISERRLLQYVKYNLPSTEKAEVLLMLSQLTSVARDGTVG